VGNDAPTKVWIVRKGNGQVRVHPSPVQLRRGETFRINNLTDVNTTAIFPRGTVVGPAGVMEVITTRMSLSPDLQVVADRPLFFEYDVLLDGGGYAEGGSKPGGIVDP